MFENGFKAATKTRVNILKKVKVDGQWKLCPAVIESSGKLKDRVRVNGQTEIHSEGVYYIEWRDSGQRKRQSIPTRQDVLEQARLKALELETAKLRPDINVTATDVHCTNPIAPRPVAPPAFAPLPSPQSMTSAAGIILQGIESYLQTLIAAAVQSQLAALGLQTAPHENRIPMTSPVPSAPNHIQVPQLVISHSASRGEPKPPKEENKGKLIADAVDSYLKSIEPPQREQKTYDEYRLVLFKFRDSCEKKYLQDLDRDDVLAFRTHLFSMGNEARTVFNRLGIVEQMLKRSRITGLLEKGDKPKWVGGLREMYQPHDLEALFKACSPNERVLYMFFLFTGERDKEVRYTSWDDIDFERNRARVTTKKRLGFKPKDKEEREIPVPSLLLTTLKAYKERQSGYNPHNLVFPTTGGKPDRKFENKLKRIARRANLNCGHCESKYGNKCSEGPHCGKWYLHKFRHTFATTSLENGVSIRTLQEWLGHSDLESTMTYLKFVQRKDIQELLDSSEMAGLAAQSLGAAPAAAISKASA